MDKIEMCLLLNGDLYEVLMNEHDADLLTESYLDVLYHDKPYVEFNAFDNDGVERNFIISRKLIRNSMLIKKVKP